MFTSWMSLIAISGTQTDTLKLKRNDSVLETNIAYVVPTKGKWYFIIENNG
jgi:hypothetical protein